jgi:hypothetical protein
MNKRIRKKVMKKGFETVGECLCKPEIVDLFCKMMVPPKANWFLFDTPKDKIKVDGRE